MADDTVKHDEDLDSSAETDTGPTNAGDQTSAQDEATTESDQTAKVPVAVAVRLDNAARVGQLRLHFPSRSITLIADGDAALRLLSMGAHQAWSEAMDPITDTSSAGRGWIMVDTAEMLAAEWIPGLPTSTRVTVDPAP